MKKISESFLFHCGLATFTINRSAATTSGWRQLRQPRQATLIVTASARSDIWLRHPDNTLVSIESWERQARCNIRLGIESGSPEQSAWRTK